MSRVITFSRTFPVYHPKAGRPTHFIEKILHSIANEAVATHMMSLMPNLVGDPFIKVKPKHHTIRSGNRWNVGDKFSPRVWSGKPYASKMITIAPDIAVEKIWNVEVDEDRCFWVYADNEEDETILDRVAKNDGLSRKDLLDWFDKPMAGQIICWNKDIQY